MLCGLRMWRMDGMGGAKQREYIIMKSFSQNCTKFTMEMLAYEGRLHTEFKENRASHSHL